MIDAYSQPLLTDLAPMEKHFPCGVKPLQQLYTKHAIHYMPQRSAGV